MGCVVILSETHVVDFSVDGKRGCWINGEQIIKTVNYNCVQMWNDCNKNVIIKLIVSSLFLLLLETHGQYRIRYLTSSKLIDINIHYFQSTTESQSLKQLKV